MTHQACEIADSAPPDGPQGELDSVAASFGVSPAIHESDWIYRFVRREAHTKDAAQSDYIKGGADAAAWLKRTIAAIRSVNEPFSLLEFAAGYGRVSRHIPLALPQAHLVASDIHREAVDFLAKIGISAHQSSSSPDKFDIKQKFDVIFALSFFTHMPRQTWGAWLRALLACLAPGGHIIFTTHGMPGMKVMGEAHGRTLSWDEDGFWFEPMSEQEDIDGAEYGSTGTSFRFVNSQIEACGGRLFSFQERGAGYQDVYIVRDATPGDDRQGVSSDAYAGIRQIKPPKTPDPADCLFYHSMDVPGLGPVNGQWDLRGTEQDLLGDVSLAGRSVLEVGPASGYLTFWMERQGAHVTSLDLDLTERWDIVPFHDRDETAVHAERAELIRKVHNAWWYTRAASNAKADCIYGTAYKINKSLGLFDVVTINNVLLHLRDPLLALERAAGRARQHIIVTDVSEHQFAAGRGECALHFIPRAAAGGPIDGWWHVPSTLVEEYLRILGFTSVSTRHFKAKFQDGHLWDLYTVVGSRKPTVGLPHSASKECKFPNDAAANAGDGVTG